MQIELGRPTDRKPPFRYSAVTRVWFSDTDAQGVVYYGRYLPYFDFARVEYHRHLGLRSLQAGEHEFVMRASNVSYEAPARFDDLLEIFVRTTRIGRSSVTQEFAAWRIDDDRLMCTATQTLVLIDVATRQPIAVPDDFRRVVARFEGPGFEGPGFEGPGLEARPEPSPGERPTARPAGDAGTDG